uniref:Aminotransferase class I/classII domain-containing protein n=1 Tax=Panagrolaimus sp. ES5 TaxID=591445 RepID=A0AC34FG89_9BILA
MMQCGEPSTREAVASFINAFCAPNLKIPINKDQLVLVPGVTYTSDLLSHAIFDEGDSLITFAPLYYRFPNDFGDRGLIHVESIDGYNPATNTVELNVEKFEEKFQKLEAEGKPVKAILLVNPRNPDGGVFALEELKPIVEWAVKKHSLYVIFDEIYNLTVFDPLPNGQSYESGIKIFDNDSSLDRTKLVWTWGLSKIFSIPGLRVAAIYSCNERLLKSVNRSLMYQGLNVITQHFVRELLNDHQWISYFFQINQQLLKTAKDYCIAALKTFSSPDKTVRFLESQSAFFILVDFSDFLGAEKSWDEERKLHQKFKDEKVLIVSGQALFMSTPGWFRIVFSSGPKDELLE